MTTTQTSLEAFESIKLDLNNREKQVYESILLLYQPNNLDISKHLGLPINSITPRVNELANKKIIICGGTKLDKRTGRNTQWWEIA